MTRPINGHDLYYGIIRGSEHVIRIKSHLNQINVFPVPDGDTGTNLTCTMNAVIKRAERHDSVEQTLKSISRGAIEGARGNSGVIMAEYLGGLYRQAVNFKTLSEKEFALLFTAASQAAVGAVAKPVDGSILTVMNDFAAALHRSLDKGRDLVQSLEDAYQRALVSLKETQHRLKVLREAGVVDSGAKGFVAFVEGLTEFFRSGCKAFTVTQALMPTLEEVHRNELIGVDLTHRYCCEILLEQHRTPDRAHLGSLGDSLVVAGREDLLKVHLHTNHPDRLMRYMADHGLILEQKVDDMIIQQRALTRPAGRIALVTDSIADLPRSLIDSHPIFILPMNILIDNVEYLDRLTLAPADFFDLADRTDHFPRSAMPKVRDIERILDFAASHYDQVLVLTVAARLSGTHQLIARMLKDQFSDRDIRLVDTRLNSGAQGLLVREAAAMISAGQSMDTIVNKLESLRERIRIYVSVDDFTYMVRGGRVSPLKGRLAKALNLKPIVSLDEEGRGIAFSSAFSRNQNLRKMKRIVARISDNGGIASYCILHGANPELATRYRKEFTQLTGMPPDYIEEISPVVGISAGRGAAAIALIMKES